MTGIVTDNLGRSSGLVKAAAGGGVWTLIETITASSDSTIEFDSGIDGTYPIYVIKFINIHPATDETHFEVNFRDGSTAYDATKTTTNIQAYHNEDDSTGILRYEVSEDLAQSTGVQQLATYQGNDSDQALCGYLTLFAPSDTTFIKHFQTRISTVQGSDRYKDVYSAGYCNVTAAIDGVQFSMSSGNIDLGKFKLYGLSDS